MTTLKSYVLRLAQLSIAAVPLWFMTAAFGYKFGIWGLNIGLSKMVFSWGIYVLGAGLLIGLAAFVAAIVSKPRRGATVCMALVAIAVPAAGFVKAASVKKTAASLPYIHDISTDAVDAPVFTGTILAQREATDGVNSAKWAGKKDPRGEALVADLQREGYPDITTILLDQSPELIFEHTLDIVKSNGWEIANQDRAELIIEATDTTFWYGFKDDIIIRIRVNDQDGKQGASRIDMRSLSRIGGSDLGKNASRIRDYRQKISK
mgnify:CR=1 FL=1